MENNELLQHNILNNISDKVNHSTSESSFCQEKRQNQSEFERNILISQYEEKILLLENVIAQLKRENKSLVNVMGETESDIKRDNREHSLQK